MAQSGNGVSVRLALVEQTLRDHIAACNSRAARAERWMQVLGGGILVLIGEAALRLFWH